MNWIVPVSITFFTLSACPSAFGQGYTYSYGSSRVINQSSNGLAQPSSSYIGTGTMSKSAQGVIQSGAQVNPGLPKVNRGAYLGTPGDNLYSMNPIFSQEQKQPTVQRPSKYAPKPQPKETQNTYVPDPNVPLTYADFKTESSSQSEKNIGTQSGNAYHSTAKQPSSP